DLAGRRERPKVVGLGKRRVEEDGADQIRVGVAQGPGELERPAADPAVPVMRALQGLEIEDQRPGAGCVGAHGHDDTWHPGAVGGIPAGPGTGRQTLSPGGLSRNRVDSLSLARPLERSAEATASAAAWGRGR